MMRLLHALDRAYLVFIDRTDLGGSDGRVSFAKLVIVAILCWAIRANEMDTGMATLLVCAAFGRPVLYRLIDRIQLGIGSVRQRVHETSQQTIDQTLTVRHMHDPGA